MPLSLSDRIKQNRSIQLIRNQLRQGTSVRKLSLAIVIGVLLGIIPVFGFITFVAAAVASWLRLNVAVLLAVLYLVMPLQVLLFVPFIRLGELLFGIERLLLAPQRIIEQIQAQPWEFTLQIWHSIAGALGAWVLVSIVTGIFLYQVLVRLIRIYRR